MQKLLAKEFLLVLTFLLLSIPMAFALLWMTSRILSEAIVAVLDQGVATGVELFALMYIAAFALLYFARVTIGFLQVTLGKEEASKNA
ncbi:MAG: hypothetical protein ACFB10_16745 [Salibacteraceae bacterium]